MAGDGKTDRPGTREFWVTKSSGGVLVRQSGLGTDQPLAAYNVY